ncbi:MAG: hypothetical protein OJF51_001374 [Nitrospira sp.]|nr:MAG: hypothetical protein OJF51_001374 [Nitrospira sp.]
MSDLLYGFGTLCFMRSFHWKLLMTTPYIPCRKDLSETFHGNRR